MQVNPYTPETAKRFDSYSPVNAQKVNAHFAGCGCRAYDSVFTYKRWQALGQQVKHGEHGLKVHVVLLETEETEDPKTGEIKREVVNQRPWTAYVFCKHQVEPKQEES
jgi:antirestriction protein ArdC